MLAKLIGDHAESSVNLIAANLPGGIPHPRRSESWGSFRDLGQVNFDGRGECPKIGDDRSFLMMDFQSVESEFDPGLALVCRYAGDDITRDNRAAWNLAGCRKGHVLHDPRCYDLSRPSVFRIDLLIEANGKNCAIRNIDQCRLRLKPSSYWPGNEYKQARQR